MTRLPSIAHTAIFLVLTLALGACGLLGASSGPTQEEVQKREMYKYGSMLGGEGGLNLLSSGKRADGEQGGGGLGVNSFLWRASLDTLSFMPIASADPFGGVILTDWYSPADAPESRFKVNVYILDRQLRADALRVSVFRQSRERGGSWHDTKVGADTSGQLEDTILTRARQLRVAQAPKD